jgi:hypothetical protein
MIAGLQAKFECGNSRMQSRNAMHSMVTFGIWQKDIIIDNYAIITVCFIWCRYFD